MPDFNVNKYPKTRKYLSLYFHAHQPWRMNGYLTPFDVDKDMQYFGGPSGKDNTTILYRVADRNYIPAGRMFLELIQTRGLKLSYSFSGTVLKQLEVYRPEVLDLYRQMFNTGKMEFIAETYYHSLAAFYDTSEFIRQTEFHQAQLNRLFNAHATVFRNTELTYRNDIGELVRNMGFKAIFAEGWDPILEWRSPNYMYRNKPTQLSNEQTAALEQRTDNFAKGEPASGWKEQIAPEIKLLLKNYRRSDDIAFRFQLKGWEGYPVTADKFAAWVASEPGYFTNLCMDYETVGEHHREESGIFEFYRHLPEELAKKGIEFILPSEAAEAFSSEDELNYSHIVSWADAERDLSAWTGNKMQEKALAAIYQIKNEVWQKVNSLSNEDEKNRILDVWGKLQTSDHYYYMSTKYWSDGDVHRYFSPYETPYHAFIAFLNVLNDFRGQIKLS